MTTKEFVIYAVQLEHIKTEGGMAYKKATQLLKSELTTDLISQIVEFIDMHQRNKWPLNILLLLI